MAQHALVDTLTVCTAAGGRPVKAPEAQPKHASAAALNHGRHASSAVRLAIQAPLMPSTTSTKGTTQHTDAPMAATLAARMAVRGDLAGLVDTVAY